MEKLTNKEEEVMQALWKLKKAFVKEILAEMPNSKLHYNTVSTLVRKLEDKNFVAHEAFGNTHRYYPTISIEAYSSYFMKNASQKFFDNSYKKMVSFFAKEEKISAEELREILEIIENKK
ncbi:MULTISPECIES: BlaI/MecI/CopY family transcriptional regulator [Mesonia]|uniref:Transcriptional regulator n=1 Tax=Mesonia mobilis TaxID=369791 RepID=A0ABQ3BI67_9FLAO|nr:BlaI/MecI/CopY family transcriptional regulator [Mesonia mobilis]MBQ0737492.1 BlaI/MecI/CopY family transcriptional regulator [Aquimarina celericrescens]GGZ46392.1 transcriptional regulator [Mesonia mobilis]|tara:strand:+ start:551 stop:910 length:360 start_codon:yes stop_codon:yes gene_type:complete